MQAMRSTNVVRESRERLLLSASRLSQLKWTNVLRNLVLQVGSIVQARRSVAAYQQLPRLQKVLEKFKLQGAPA